MERIGEPDQVLLRAEVRIEGVEVAGPVAMVRVVRRRVLRVLYHGRDPDRRETHALDVIQLVRDALPGAPTILFRQGAVRVRVGGFDYAEAAVVRRRPREPVRDDLVDCLLLPFLGAQGVDASHSGAN